MDLDVTLPSPAPGRLEDEQPPIVRGVPSLSTFWPGHPNQWEVLAVPTSGLELQFHLRNDYIR